MDNLVNVDLKPVAKVANNLINKISKAVGWRYTRTTPETIARETLIKEIQKLNLSPLEKAAYISNADRIIKEYSNQKNIVQMALSRLSENSKPEEIDDDWLNEFMDKARLVSDEEFQLLWARILAGEAEHKNSFSIRTLDKVKSMSKNEAEIFLKVAKVVMGNDNYKYIINDSITNNNHNVTFNDLFILEECGFVRTDTKLYKMHVEDGAVILIDNTSTLMCMIKIKDTAVSEFSLDVFPFTKSGMELLNAVVVKYDISYFVDIAKYLKKKYINNPNYEIFLYKINALSNDRVEYDQHDLLNGFSSNFEDKQQS